MRVAPAAALVAGLVACAADPRVPVDDSCAAVPAAIADPDLFDRRASSPSSSAEVTIAAECEATHGSSLRFMQARVLVLKDGSTYAAASEGHVETVETERSSSPYRCLRATNEVGSRLAALVPAALRECVAPDETEFSWGGFALVQLRVNDEASRCEMYKFHQPRLELDEICDVAFSAIGRHWPRMPRDAGLGSGGSP